MIKQLQAEHRQSNFVKKKYLLSPFSFHKPEFYLAETLPPRAPPYVRLFHFFSRVAKCKNGIVHQTTSTNPVKYQQSLSYYLTIKINVMADFKRRTFLLSSGKQIKLFGNSTAIGKSLEIGEGYAPNIFSCTPEQSVEKSTLTVSNPYKLTAEEMMELADL